MHCNLRPADAAPVLIRTYEIEVATLRTFLLCYFRSRVVFYAHITRRFRFVKSIYAC